MTTFAYNKGMLPNIDWAEVEHRLGTRENGDEEGIIHELCHMYDCIGVGAFKYVGPQGYVGHVIRTTYPLAGASDQAEVEVSAMTYIVMRNFGVSTEYKDTIIRQMMANLRLALEIYETEFYSCLGNPRIEAKAAIVLRFLNEFRMPLGI